MSKQNKVGVILLNMGGPEKLDDVRPFLFNLFSDREIIRLGPVFLQKPIAWFIAKKRAPKSRRIYNAIGGRSPLAQLTAQQGEALSRMLSAHGDFTVDFAMRYWPPTAIDTLKQFQEKSISNIVALTLYPHYSRATTGSSLKDLHRANRAMNNIFSITEIDSWPNQPQYIKCLAENISKGLEQFNNEAVEIVYSAHSLPVSFIEEGDPYVEHLQQTIDDIEAITKQPGRLCYQSRSGPVEWLSPSTPEMIEQLAGDGKKNILMVPISFVSDHVETLYEINIQYREQARSLGMRLEPTESLNCNPKFIECLKELVLENVNNN